MKKWIKKWLIILTATMVVMSCLTGCSDEITSNGQLAETGTTKAPKLENCKPIAEVRKAAYGDLQEVKGKYDNLLFDAIQPYCPDTDVLYEIINPGIKPLYKGIDNEKDILPEQFKLLDFIFGDELDTLVVKKFETQYCWALRGSEYATFDDFLKDDEENAKRLPAPLIMIGGNANREKYTAQVDPLFLQIGFDRSGFAKAVKDAKKVGKYQERRLINDHIIESHYVYTENKAALQKKWKLKNGEMSLQEGIEFVENYLNYELPIEEPNDDVLIKVQMAHVLKMGNVYFFRYDLRKEICGLGTQIGEDGGGGTIATYYWDYAFQYEVDRVDDVFCETRREYFDKTEEVKEIISLADAIQILKKEAAENARYQIYGVELGYYFRTHFFRDPDEEASEIEANEDPDHRGMEQLENGEWVSRLVDYTKADASRTYTICWVFRWQNQLDNQYGLFYVDAQTGEIYIDTWRVDKK